MFVQSKIAILTLLAACMVLISCGNPSVKNRQMCEMLAPELSATLLHNIDDREHAYEVIRDVAGVEESKITSHYLGGSQVDWDAVLGWQDGDNRYAALFYREQLLQIRVTYSDQVSSIQEVLDCLGKPDYYRQVQHDPHDGNRLLIDLVYSDKGLVITLLSDTLVDVSDFESPRQLYTIRTVLTGTFEETIAHAYWGMPDPARLEPLQLQEWLVPPP